MRVRYEELRIADVLRQCAVPKLNYLLPCTAPVCITQQAADFDDTVITTACAGAQPPILSGLRGMLISRKKK
jgi:hypothetical protein